MNSIMFKGNTPKIFYTALLRGRKIHFDDFPVIKLYAFVKERTEVNELKIELTIVKNELEQLQLSIKEPKNRYPSRYPNYLYYLYTSNTPVSRLLVPYRGASSKRFS